MKNLLTKLIFYIRLKIRKYSRKGRGYFLKLYLNSCGCTVGKNLECWDWPVFRAIPYRNIIIGDNVIVGYNITFEVGTNGLIKLGNNVFLTQNVLISALKSVFIDDYSGAAEYVSIRDSYHFYRKGEYHLKETREFSKGISIGKDCSIGSGSFISLGSNIPDGVVLGVNSLVGLESNLEPDTFYSGNRLKFIRKRK